MRYEQSTIRLLFLAIQCGFFLLPAISPAVSHAVETRPEIRTDGEQIILETNHLSYVVGTNGLNVAFRDQRNGKNYLAPPNRRLSCVSAKMTSCTIRYRWS